MSRVVHPDFQRGQRVEPYRPSFLRRTISRYQLVELFVIIGIILMVWGALSLGRVATALQQHASSGWLDSVRVEVLDGDSIRSGRQVYRLVGFNTPESGFGTLSPAPTSTFAACLAPVRAAPKERDNVITAGCAAH